MYRTTLANTSFIHLDGNTAIIGAPNSFAQQKLEERWGHISRALGDVLGREIDMRFIPIQELVAST